MLPWKDVWVRLVGKMTWVDVLVPPVMLVVMVVVMSVSLDLLLAEQVALATGLAEVGAWPVEPVEPDGCCWFDEGLLLPLSLFAVGVATKAEFSSLVMLI